MKSTSSDFTLYYWPVPFRGQFIRAILTYAGRSFDEPDGKAIAALLDCEPDKQPYPFMGPPLLIDHEDGSSVAQMPAIAFYLGEKLGLMPASLIGRARSLKVVNDANDVIDELTLEGGVYRLWDDKLWKEFEPRLQKWMAIFESTAQRHDLKADAGYLFGGSEPGIADIVTATLWGTMTEALPATGGMLNHAAPSIAGLVRRVNAIPTLATLARESAKRFGGQYCGGEIEKSLRAVAT